MNKVRSITQGGIGAYMQANWLFLLGAFVALQAMALMHVYHQRLNRSAYIAGSVVLPGLGLALVGFGIGASLQLIMLAGLVLGLLSGLIVYGLLRWREPR